MNIDKIHEEVFARVFEALKTQGSQKTLRLLQNHFDLEHPTREQNKKKTRRNLKRH